MELKRKGKMMDNGNTGQEVDDQRQRILKFFYCWGYRRGKLRVPSFTGMIRHQGESLPSLPQWSWEAVVGKVDEGEKQKNPHPEKSRKELKKRNMENVDCNNWDCGNEKKCMITS